MNRLAACAVFLLAVTRVFAAPDPAHPFQPPQKSISSSQQFIIYCDDKAMRLAVSTFCEDTKSGILQLITQRDEWKVPIVVNLLRPDATAPGQPLTDLQLYTFEGGTKKIEITVVLRGDFKDIRFQQQVIRAILLEMEYRGIAEWDEKNPTIQPPSWLVEGLAVYLKTRNAETDSDVYTALLQNSQMPGIGDFLTQSTAGLNASSLQIYQAYAYSFLQLLTSLQGGPQGLAWYIHDLPKGKDSPSTDLIKHFPALGGSEENMQKWWTLSMARLAAANRYKGSSVEDTEKHLAELLKFTMPTGKNNDPKEYPVENFKEYLKNPKRGPVLAEASLKLRNFANEASPLFRPIILSYVDVIDGLAKGNTRRADEQLKQLAKYREMLVTRIDQIADYMNWFEATQLPSRSNSFEEYMKTAKQISNDTPQRDDAVSRYMDGIETQMH